MTTRFNLKNQALLLSLAAFFAVSCGDDQPKDDSTEKVEVEEKMLITPNY